MKILYVASKYDYGDPARGFSYEHENFYLSLRYMNGHQIKYFDFTTYLVQLGRRGMNELLWKTVQSFKPDLMFCCLFREELDQKLISRISQESRTTTYNWFCDDHFRFKNFSSRWAHCFNYVSTTDHQAIPKYHRIGYKNVLLTQWACNTHIYKKLGLRYSNKHPVSFVGQPHGSRRALIDFIRKTGQPVYTAGFGWDRGSTLSKLGYKLGKTFPLLAFLGHSYIAQGNHTRVSQEKMIEIFNSSKINLNLSNAYKEQQDQIKGRIFEIPGCGGFLLTHKTIYLERYYKIGQEIICFDDQNDLLEKIKYYLANDKAREAIAVAGYHRTQKEHSYLNRFQKLFAQIKLKKPA
jgi:spore maturation protein CgeB